MIHLTSNEYQWLRLIIRRVCDAIDDKQTRRAVFARHRATYMKIPPDDGSLLTVSDGDFDDLIERAIAVEACDDLVEALCHSMQGVAGQFTGRPLGQRMFLWKLRTHDPDAPLDC